MKNIKLAEKSGFCFGVKRAVDSAITCANEFQSTIYTLGPLIHNNDVVEYLKQNNINPINFNEIDSLNAGDIVIIRSHGVKPTIIDYLDKKRLKIIDATCPYVSNIHKKVAQYYKLGYKIVIVGDENHPEVIGINGWCDDEAIISKNGSDLPPIRQKVCIVSQTTEKQENWQKVLNKITPMSKEIVAFNTICSATEVRQKSAEELSISADAMIVIGGKNSSNTTKLFQICKKNCEHTFHVENANEIPEYIINSNNIINIGVTAGASTPDWIIKEVINKIQKS